MKQKVAFILSFVPLMLTACGGSASYIDGTYTAQSSVYEEVDESADGGGNGYGVVTLTIQDNVITECEYLTYEVDGTLKDEDYGKQNGEIANSDYYNKAQKAVRASASYAEQLVEYGALKDVDAISGATISFDLFNEAVTSALKQAKG